LKITIGKFEVTLVDEIKISSDKGTFLQVPLGTLLGLKIFEGKIFLDSNLTDTILSSIPNGGNED